MHAFDTIVEACRRLPGVENRGLWFTPATAKSRAGHSLGPGCHRWLPHSSTHHSR